MARQGRRRNRPAHRPGDPVRKTCKGERAARIELGKLACTGKPFTEHRNIPDLRPDPADPRLEWEQAADRVRAAIRSGQLTSGDPLPSVPGLARLQGLKPATVRHAFLALADEGLVHIRHGRTTMIAGELSADAQAQRDETGAASAKTLAAQLAAKQEQLEAGNARYEQWAADTHGTRETAGKARAELQRRGQPQPDGEQQVQPHDEPQTTAGWWREFEADLQAVERAIARQHQAAIDAGESWPPQRAPDLESTPTTNPQAQPVSAQPESEYAARIEHQAQAGPEAGHQAEAREGIEIEM